MEDGVAMCSGPPAETCDDIEAAYTAATTGDAMSCETECHILNGHCGVGLGSCYYGVNTGVSQSELDGIATRWVRLGCGGAVCDCGPPPESVRCDAGGCLLRAG